MRIQSSALHKLTLTAATVGLALFQTGCVFNSDGQGGDGECGNGIAELSEQCDDGNTINGDGCDANCQIEIPATCGDGNVDSGEECDDGNQIPCDACSNACREVRCGNGTRECGEICDVGQLVDNCESLGFAGGTLACNAACDGYDNSACLLRDGEACTAAGQCFGGLCLTEQAHGHPSGSCTSDCSTSQCSNGGVCADWGGDERCYRGCTDSNGCRSGYFCRSVNGANGLLCLPLCTQGADCPVVASCNEWLGTCGPAPSPLASDNGAACTQPSECKGICSDLVDDGYCTSTCNFADPSCPGTDLCVQFHAGDGDLGFCLKTCNVPLECARSTYDCIATAFSGGHTVCWDPAWSP